MNAEITYLDNSGFIVKTKRCVLIYDYWNTYPESGKSGLGGGVIDPHALKKDNVYVFVSHAHGDHFTREIFRWREIIPNIAYILSDDVPPVPGAVTIKPDHEIAVGAIRAEALHSTDEGVAFLTEADGLIIYHAGDLNWWHWEGEDPAWNSQMENDFKKEIGKIADLKMDFAFVPVDPRLKDQAAWGIRYFAENVDAKMILPMHYGTQAQAAANAINRADIHPKNPKTRIVPPLKRGQQTVYNASDF